MKQFLKLLPYKKALPPYLLIFILATLFGHFIMGWRWYGFSFSLLLLGSALTVDIILTYRKYKEIFKNRIY